MGNKKKSNVEHEWQQLIFFSTNPWVPFSSRRRVTYAGVYVFIQKSSGHNKILPRTLWRFWDIGKLVCEHETTIAVGSICEKFNVNFITFKHYWYWWSSATRSFLLSTFTADTQFVIYTRIRIYIVQIKHKKMKKKLISGILWNRFVKERNSIIYVKS